jgi:hypothetical protein
MRGRDAAGIGRILIVAMLVAGCGAVGPVTEAPVATMSEELAWTRPPNLTTCDQWNRQMTKLQRVQMAREVLAALRWNADPLASAGTELAPTFAAAITESCGLPEVVALGIDQYVINAAGTVAFMRDGRFQPVAASPSPSS